MDNFKNKLLAILSGIAAILTVIAAFLFFKDESQKNELDAANLKEKLAPLDATAAKDEADLKTQEQTQNDIKQNMKGDANEASKETADDLVNSFKRE